MENNLFFGPAHSLGTALSETETGKAVTINGDSQEKAHGSLFYCCRCARSQAQQNFEAGFVPRPFFFESSPQILRVLLTNY